jgi:hypothetical protein
MKRRFLGLFQNFELHIMGEKNFKQNIDETQSKQPKIHMKIHTSLWILKISRKICEPKVLRLLPNVCDFQKENHTLKVWI